MEKMHLNLMKTWLKKYEEDSEKEYRTELKKWFWERFFQINEEWCFWKDNGECKKT